MTAGQIINTGWRLYLSHFKVVLLNSLFFTMITIGSYISLTKMNNIPVIISTIYKIVENPLIIPIFLILILSAIIIFYSGLFFKLINNISLQSQFQFNFSKILKIFLISLYVFIEILLLTIINCIIYISLLFLYASITVFLNKTLYFVSLGLWVIFSILYLVIHIALSGICFFQLPIIEIDHIRIIKSLFKSIKIITFDIVKYFYFILLLLSLLSVLGINLYICLYVIITLCLNSNIFAHNTITAFADILSLLMTTSFILPFFAASLMVYFYSNKAITEGYDLKIILIQEDNNLKKSDIKSKENTLRL